MNFACISGCFQPHLRKTLCVFPKFELKFARCAPTFETSGERAEIVKQRALLSRD